MTPMWLPRRPVITIMDDPESDIVYTPEEMAKLKEWYTKSTDLRIAELKAKEEKNAP